MFRDAIEKKLIKKMIQKIAIKRIRTKFDIKIKWNKCLEIEFKKKKQINQENNSKQNK